MWHRRRGLPEDWLTIVEQHVALWQVLDDRERESLEVTSDWLLRHKHWEASNGFALTDEVMVTIAAQAAMLILELEVDEYRDVSAIIVYPTAMVSGSLQRGPAAGTIMNDPVGIIGEAHERRGPVLVAWDEADQAARQPGRGRNVVFHEFAHKLDMADGVVDGTPLLHSRHDAERWVAVCTEVFNALRAGVDRPPLSPYGATNVAEFFAVATEAFFDAPTELEHREPALYEVLRDFFKQDPARRLSSSS
jgi:Mlc titration factor MtfA (ptsG expression regulator)